MLENLLDRAVQLLWGRGTIAFTLLCGLYFTVFTHFLPLRKIGLVTQKTLGSLFCKKESKDSVSPFAAVSTALGGTMGVGNIIGVGAALALGGAGSIFWMWVGALLGMMTKYMEVFLAVRWRVRRPGSRSFCGGPMYYCARHPTSHRQAVGGAVLHLLYPLEPVQRQHGPDQRHRPVDAAELFGFPFPVRCGIGAGVRVGAARRL